jgi:RNA polymerase-binding transcription factor DksA
MSQEGRTRYSENELKEFEAIILGKIALAKNELTELKKSISKGGDTGADITNSSTKVLEDGADTMEKENMNQLAARQQKFINNLENALIRIKNGTYGVCIDSGKLISKERLKAVPHTMHSIEAKLAQRN